MTHTYRPNDNATPELREESARLAARLNEAQPEFTLQVLHKAPSKTWAGMLIYADGTDYDPGSGEGVYRRNKGNSAWVHLG